MVLSEAKHRQRLQVTNRSGSASVFLGGADVTTTNGYELANGATIQFDLDTSEAVYAVAAGSNTRVDVITNKRLQ